MSRKKKLLGLIGLAVVLAAMLGTWVLFRQNRAAQQEKEDLQWFCDAYHISGRWVSQDRAFSLLVYMDEDLTNRARLYTTQGAFEGVVEAGTGENNSLVILADQNDGQYPQMELTPLEMLDDAHHTYKIKATYLPAASDAQEIGEYELVFSKLTDEAEQVTEDNLAEWMSAINEELSLYYQMELGVMNIELDRDGIYDANGGYVGKDGFIHGTGIVAPVSGGVFQMGSSEIAFVLDPAAPTVKVCQLINETSGDVITAQSMKGNQGETAPTETAEENEQKPESEENQPGEQTVDQMPAKPAAATEQEWKQAYFEVLMEESTYQYNGSNMYAYSIYLIDVDDNGIPELYVCEGQEPSTMLRQAYDFSAGRMESSCGLEIPFVPYVAVNRNTGERVLYGDNGGMLIWDTMILRPVSDGLGFEPVIIEHTGKDWNEQTQMQQAHTEQVSDQYRCEDFEVNYDRQMLSSNGIALPDENAIREFLEM